MSLSRQYEIFLKIRFVLLLLAVPSCSQMDKVTIAHNFAALQVETHRHHQATGVMRCIWGWTQIELRFARHTITIIHCWLYMNVTTKYKSIRHCVHVAAGKYEQQLPALLQTKQMRTYVSLF